MKRWYFLLFFVLLINFNVKSQSIIFEKVFNWSSSDHLLDFIPTNDQGYAVLGRSHFQSFVLKLDSSGDSLWTYFIGHVGDAWEPQLIQSQNSDLLIASQINGYGSILRLSNSGDSISCVLYPSYYDVSFFNGIIEKENGDIVVTHIYGQTSQYATPNTSLRCFDENGVMKWYKALGDNNIANSIILNSENEIVVTGVYNWWDKQIWIAKRDSVGNYIYSNFLGATQGIQIIESSSGDLYASVDGSSEFGSYNALKLNTSGIAEWNLYDNNGVDGHSNTICELKPNRFAIGGANQDGLAIKVFDGNGDSISFFNYDKYYVQSAKRIFEDDDCLVVGGFKKEPDDNRSILVFKILLDSLYTSNNPTNIADKQSKPLITPNPANSFINLNHLPEDKYSNFELELRDMSGNLVLIKEKIENDERIDISKLEAGIYFYTIIQNNTVIKTDKIIIN